MSDGIFCFGYCACVSVTPVKCLESMAKYTWARVLSGSDFPKKMYPLFHNAVFCVWEKKTSKIKGHLIRVSFSSLKRSQTMKVEILFFRIFQNDSDQ